MTGDDDWEDFGDCLSLLNEATMPLMKTYFDRFRHEMVGAYRAGYDVLDVVRPRRPPDTVQDDTKWNATLAIRVAFIPAEDTGIRTYPPESRVESVDLSVLDDSDLDGFLQLDDEP